MLYFITFQHQQSRNQIHYQWWFNRIWLPGSTISSEPNRARHAVPGEDPPCLGRHPRLLQKRPKWRQVKPMFLKGSALGSGTSDDETGPSLLPDY